jgi:(E)-4-hydroxy-3-methylbut-2-enyl-diphosphate synthase
MVFLLAFILWISGFDIARLGAAAMSAARRRTVTVDVGGVKVGSSHPVVVQSMTNTDTADPDATAIQVARLAHAGSELVRVTVNNDGAAGGVPDMLRKLRDLGVGVPVIGDFHYNGHQLLVEYPEMARGLAKYRINRATSGAKRHDENFQTIVRVAIENEQARCASASTGARSTGDPHRPDGRQREARRAARVARRDDRRDGRVGDALRGARRGNRARPRPDHPVGQGLERRDVVDTYRILASKSDYPLHVGLTEAGLGMKGIVASTAGLAILLEEGIGDTIRVSLTPAPGGEREEEVRVAQQVLQSMGLRSFLPQVSACPGCGRTTSTFFQEMAERIQGLPARPMPAWQARYPASRTDRGGHGLRRERPGESKHADIGISLPGTFEEPVAPVFIDGRLDRTLRGDGLVDEFIGILEGYVDRRYGSVAAPRLTGPVNATDWRVRSRVYSGNLSAARRAWGPPRFFFGGNGNRRH